MIQRDDHLPTVDVRPVPLAKAARLARLAPEDLLALAIATADWPPEDRISILPGPGGPWFDPVECKGLGYILDGNPDIPRTGGVG